tara:strand:- start:384 stop:1967 length:1584 start_codon:yes stop_codon:yes gene_type:complete
MSKEPGTVLKRGPSGCISDGDYNTKIQIALLGYFNSHGFDIQDPIMIQLLTNIMKHTRGEKTSTSEKDVYGYLTGLQIFKDDILKAHLNCKLVTDLKNLLLSDDNNHYEKLQQLKPAYKALEQAIKENNTEIERLQKKGSKGSRSKSSRKGVQQDIADKTEQVKVALEKKTEMDKALEEVMVQMKLLQQAIENQIKQLEQFIYLMLIITIIYDKSVLHLLIAGPLFSYQDGNTHSTKIREGIGKKHGWMGCNKKLLDLESTLQVVDAMYQWREIINSGKGITDKQIDAVVSGINKRGAPPEVTGDIKTLKQVIRLCTFRDNFVNFDPFSQEVKQGSLKKKRTRRKKTQHKKTQHKKTNRKKTNRKKTNRKKSKKSVKTGGSGLSEDNVANIIILVFIVLLFAQTPVLLAMLEAFVIAFAVNLVVFLINGIRSICWGGEEEGSQRSRGRRGSREIQEFHETPSDIRRRHELVEAYESMSDTQRAAVDRLVEKHQEIETIRQGERDAQHSLRLVQTDSAKLEEEQGLLY